MQKLPSRFPAVQFFSGGNLEGNFCIPDLLFRASEAFGDGSVGREKSARDFADAETAKRFEGECDLSLSWNQWMAADEHHSQAVVGDFLVGENRGIGRSLRAI